MKKRVVGLLAGLCIAATLVGCGSKEISNEYIKISKYKGVEVEKMDVPKVTDEDVENSIAMILADKKTDVTDRPVQNGDVVVMDYEGKKDGVAFEGGTETDAELGVGEGKFIPGFEEGLVGHSIGETFDMPITFPAEYPSEDLAGADVVFTVTVKAIKEVPELTKELVAELSENAKSVEAYKKEIKKNLTTSNKQSVEMTLADKAMEEVMNHTEVKKLPEDRVKEMQEKIKTQYETMASYYGMEFKDFIAQSMGGMTEEQFVTESEKAAEGSVKQILAMELIAKQENIIPTEKQYEAEYESLAKQYGYENVDALFEQATKEDLNMMILQDKVNGWLAKTCKQVEKKESASETKNTDDSTAENGSDSDNNAVTQEEQ